ncbi:MAG: esterase-like activity of phytase family protein [Myxococcota bacterium]|nr:esterase-like activity of phytase family protein [Myxococcota bacterium]
MRGLLLLVLAAGCSRDELHHEHTAKYFKELKLDTAPGLSGLATDDTGGFWTVAERDLKAYRITLDAANNPTLETLTIEGVPPKLDLEGVAWLGGDHFALGTEGKVDGLATVLLADRRGETLVVTRVIALPETKLGIDLPANHGAEGVCGYGSTIIVAIEGSGIENGKRFAPIVRITNGEIERVHRMWLSTKIGKLSALDCTIAADGTAEVIAVERHFSVTKILRFTLPTAEGDITPTEALDLGRALKSRLNLEGIAKTTSGRYFAVVDNQWKTLRGPSLLLVFEAGVVKERR